MVVHSASGLNVKLASEEWEFEQIHRLNYRTFAEEIPQHAPNSGKRLVDRFHAENTYVIALQGQKLIGMLALRGRRPFSLDEKLADLDHYLPSQRTPVEVRLLAVDAGLRKRTVFPALLDFAVKHGLREGYDLALISGTTRQLKLYRHLGFIPFGPLVGSDAAAYQPMLLTLESYRQVARRSPVLRRTTEEMPNECNETNFLPGPVRIVPEVRHAFEMPCLSHRGDRFQALMAQAREELCRLTGATDAQVLLGSGTLANEVVAAQLSLSPQAGLILSNGEFGERLIANARRARLSFETLRFDWSAPLDPAAVERAMARLLPGSWVWVVHHETSTGIVNSLDALKTLCGRFDLRLCVDCVSSVGAIPVDLRGVRLASCVSGKGLGAYPGLSVVFHDYLPMPQPEWLPGYLDLGTWAENHSVAYTHSSNLLSALVAALRLATPARMARIRDNMLWLRDALRTCDLPLLGDDDNGSPVVTIAPQEAGMAMLLGEELEMRGYWLSYRSGYLLERNWLQIALLGDPPREALEKLMRVLAPMARRLRDGYAQAAPLRPAEWVSGDSVRV